MRYRTGRACAGPAAYPLARLDCEGCAPFCQAAVPAAIAARAWVHFSLASSLGGTSISLIHWRVDASRCPPPMARPVRTISVPVPTIAALVISGADLNCGPFLRVSPLSMGSILRVQPDPTVTTQVPAGNHPRRVMCLSGPRGHGGRFVLRLRGAG